jgi:hypothetical protein
VFAVLVRIPGLLCLLLACLPARASELQTEFGQCRFGKERDGTFYQSNLYTRNYMTPRCASLAVADRFRDGPWGWRIAFLWTGQLAARDNVATFFDEDAFRSNLVCNNTPGPGFARGCMVNIVGHGHTWGFSFAGTYEQRLGPLRLGAEAGLFFFRHSWHMTATHLDCSTCRHINDYDESSGPFTDPSPLAGLTARVGPVYFAARYYWPAEHRALSLTDHSFLQLSSGLAWKF